MIINLSPSKIYESESNSSLQFAERIKKISSEYIIKEKNIKLDGVLELSKELNYEKEKRLELESLLESMKINEEKEIE